MKMLLKSVGVLALAVGCAALASGCPTKQEKPAEGQGAAGEGQRPAATTPGALPADSAYATGQVQAAVMDVETRLEVAGLIPEGQVSPELQQAREAAVTRQTWTMAEKRGKLVFQTADFFVPQGTELRFHPELQKYVLYLPAKQTYWAMSGAEIGNLLEGGPVMERSGYAMEITDTEERATIAGVETKRTDAVLAFDWQVKTKQGQRRGAITVNLAIWHSADPKLKPGWGAMMVDFLTMPFKDEQGQQVVAQLKERLGFPVKWEMEVSSKDPIKAKDATSPRLISEAKTLQIKEVPRVELAAAPPAARPANAPFQFEEGGQKIKEEILGMIPPSKSGSLPKPAPKPATP